MTGDFSLFSLFTAGLACIAPLANAYTQPTGDAPEGNPIYTPGKDVVPAGQPYTITWSPTTAGTVTLVLLKGPADNLKVVDPIVEQIPNSGSYSWTPSTDLQPSGGDTGYGIQLIDDATGQYQYTMQFGISNSAYQSGQAPPAYGSTTSSSSMGWSTSTTSSGWAQPTGAWGHHGGNSTGHAKPTGWSHNGTTTHVHPTGGYTTKKPTMYTSSSSAAAATTSASVPSAPAPSPQPTGAASTLTTSVLGLVFAAGVAVFAL